MRAVKTLLLVTSLTFGLAACGGGTEGGESNLDAQFRANFITSCNESATASGTATEVAADVCDCSADKVIEKYSMVERVQLRGDKVDTILDQCLTETGHAQPAEG